MREKWIIYKNSLPIKNHNRKKKSENKKNRKFQHYAIHLAC